MAEENRLRLNVLESREGCKRLLARLVEPSGSDLRATSSGQDVVLEEYVADEEERARLEVESDAPRAVPRCVNHARAPWHVEDVTVLVRLNVLDVNG